MHWECQVCPLSGVERFPLFGDFQCTNFNGRAIGTGNNVRYIEVVRSWEGPLIEVPLYMISAPRDEWASMGPGDNSNPGVYFLIGSGTPACIRDPAFI